jgi:hypothetical protein
VPGSLLRAQGDKEAATTSERSKQLRLWVRSNLRDAAGAGVGILLILFGVFVARAFMGLTPLPWSLMDIFGTAAVIALVVMMLRRPTRSESETGSRAA